MIRATFPAQNTVVVSSFVYLQPLIEHCSSKLGQGKPILRWNKYILNQEMFGSYLRARGRLTSLDIRLKYPERMTVADNLVGYARMFLSIPEFLAHPSRQKSGSQDELIV